MLGQSLNCVRCEQLEFPEKLSAFKRTPEFTADTVPRALLSRHRTAPGIWAKLQVQEGSVRYDVPEFERNFLLDSTNAGVIPPDVEHSIEPEPGSRFYIEFYRGE